MSIDLIEYWQNLAIETLESEVKRHNTLYWNQNAPEISDVDYDVLVEILRQKNPDSKVLIDLGSHFGETGTQIKHLSAMLSLDKCYQDVDLKKWADKIKGNFIMTPKIDGVACSIRYDDKGNLKVSATRGDGMIGEEITQNVMLLPSVPKKLKGRSISKQEEVQLSLFAAQVFEKINVEIEVRGEVYFPLNAFEKWKDRFSNPRNAAAGSLKHKDNKMIAELGIRFFAYDLLGIDFKTHAEKFEFLKDNGFEVVDYEVLSHEELAMGYQKIGKIKDQLNYELDGVVFRANDNQEYENLGITSHHPKGAIAYKFQGDSALTTVKGIEWSVSRTGVLTPVCLVEPVKLSGAMVSRISMHHAGMIQNKKLTIGASVMAMRRGGVIPHLESVVKDGDFPIELPSICPTCPKQCAKTKMEGDFLYCQSETVCEARLRQSIFYFAQMMGIEGFGGVWLDKLIAEGLLTSPVDLYRLKKEDLIKIDLVGEGRADAWLTSVNQSKRVGLATFLVSLGISDLGKSASVFFADTFKSLDRILTLTEAEIAQLPNFGVLTAQHIVSGLKSYRSLINELLTFIKIEDEQDREGPLKGQSFLFTGTLSQMKRAEAEHEVIELGGTIASGVSKNLSYLVLGDEGKAGSKLDKAKKLGIRILSETEFFEIIHSSIS
jgi:DNA ligase (NAD+)